MFKPTLTWIAAACMSVLLLASPARAQYKLDTLSAWGGSVNAFQKVGSIGYCGSGQRFVVLDMSDEANIHELGSINLDTTVQTFIIRGNYAYVLCFDSARWFSVIDLSTPTSPQMVWTETGSAPIATSASRIQTYGNLAYLLYPNNHTAYVYDLTNPVLPAALKTNTCASCYSLGFGSGINRTFTRDFQIIGNYAYTIGEDPQEGNGGATFLSIFNLQPDPLHPTTLVGKVLVSSDFGGNYHIAIVDGRAVVQIRVYLPEVDEERDVVRIVDVSDPAHPVLRGVYDDLYQAQGVAIQGNYAFVADWFESTDGTYPGDPAINRLKGLAILDVSDSTNPVLIGTYNTDHSQIHDVRVDGNRAYVLCGGQGLEILDISNPAQPLRVGGYYSPGALRIMTKNGNRLYAVDEFNGFTILDVSDPTVTPSVLGVYRSPGDVQHQGHWNAQVRNNLAYLSSAHLGVQVVDVSDPAAPTLVGGYAEDTDDFGAHAVELDGDILHVSGQLANQWFFANFEVSNPPEMNLIGFFFPNSFYHRLKTTQGMTFAGTGFSSVLTARIDNTDPTNPYTVNSSNDPWGGADYEIIGNRLYAASQTNTHLSIVDVTNPFSPVSLGSFDTQVQGQAVGAFGNRVYASSVGSTLYSNGYPESLAAFDMSNPTSPHVIAYSPLRHVVDIIADGDLVFAELGYKANFGAGPTWRGGIVIQKFHAACPPNLLTGSGCLGPTDLLSFLTLYFTNYDGQGSAVPGDNQTMPQVNPTSSIYAVGCMPDQQSVTPPVITAAGLKADYDGDCQVGPVDLLHFLTDYFNPASDCFASCFAAAVAPTQIKATTETPRHRVGTQSEAKSQSLKR